MGLTPLGSAYGRSGISPLGQGGGAAEAGNPWYNPLGSADIQARIDAGKLWAWRALGNGETWGAGPSTYAESLIDEAQGQVLAEIGSGPPNWNAGSGWSGFLTLVRALNTGVIPVNNQQWVVFIQYANMVATSDYIFGVASGGALISILPNWGGANTRYYNGGLRQVAGNHLTGNMAIIGNQGYRDGIADGLTVPAGGGEIAHSMYIGALNSSGATGGHTDAEIHAVLVCDDVTAFTLADIQAIALLPDGSMHNL